MPDAVCLSLKITFGQMEMQKLFTRKRKDPIEALQEQMRSIMEGHGAVTFGVQKLSYRCCSEITRTVCIGTTTRYYPHYEQYRLPNSRGKHRTLQVHWGNRLRLLRFLNLRMNRAALAAVVSSAVEDGMVKPLRATESWWHLAWRGRETRQNLHIFLHSYSRPFDSLFNYIYIYYYIHIHILLAFPLLPSFLCLVSHLEWLHVVTWVR